MRTKSVFTAVALGFAVLSAPALAQSIGGSSGGGIGGGGGGLGGGGSSPSLGAASNTIGSSGGALGASSTSTQQRATAGSTSIDSVNADAVARSGNVGAATTIGNSSGSSVGTGTGTSFQSVAGTGPAALYNIPRARVNVDLDAIRSALRAGPNATPDARGN